MKKYIVYRISYIALALVLTLYTIPYTLYAAESTPSADIKAKVEQFIKDSASKAAQLKKDLEKNLQNRAYVGKIKTKSQTAITIATKKGPRIVNLNQDTQFVSQVKTKKYSQKLISEEDYVAALGDIDENQVLTAKELILLPQPKAGQPLADKTYLWGQVVSISDEQNSSASKLVMLKDKSLKNISVSLPDNRTTKVTDFVILTGNLDKNQIFQAGFVYVIPQGGFIKPKKTATPSASVKPSTH